MKKRTIRLISFVLFICISGIFLSSCSQSDTAKNSLIMVQKDFFALLQEQKFDEIYDLLSNETKRTLTHKSFVDRYESVLKKLGTGTTITIDQIGEFQVATSIYQTIDFNMSYHSPQFGEIQDHFSLPLIREGEDWRILWTPSLLFPSMDWSDSLRVSIQKPIRGEIFASGEVVAANQTGQTVYAIPKKIQNLPQFAATLAPYVQMTSEDIIKKLAQSQLMGRVTAKTLNIRNAPSLDSDILLTLNQGETFSLKDQGLITQEQPISNSSVATSASENSETDLGQGFYRVSYQNGIEEIVGYAYTPYIESYYSQDVVILAAFPPDTLDDAARTIITQTVGAAIDETGMSTFRVYPFKESMFHIVGYVSEITETQYKKYQNTELASLFPKGISIGQMGIESQYELKLRGSEGTELYLSNYDGSNRRTLFKKDAINGQDIHLTIDPNFQQYAYNLLKLYCLKTQSGAIVANDPLTGAVRIAVSYPSLNPNSFYTMSKAEWADLNLKNTTQPFFNRALNASYAPGSIIKPFTAAVAFNHQKLTSDTVFPYQDEIKDDRWMPSQTDWIYPAVKRIENKHQNSYELNFTNSMAYSDNIYFAWVAMQVGEEDFLDYYRNKLGFEQDLSFDLPAAPATVFKESNAKATPSDNDVFNLGFLAGSGYGQGKMAMSPLFATMLFGGLANDGDIMRPYLVESIRHSEGSKYYYDQKTMSQIWKAQIVDRPYDLNIINQSLRQVMEYGTGKSVQSSMTLAGKTGTAQRSTINEISWLTVFKYDDPKDFAASVAIESKANETNTRYAIMRALTNYYMKNRTAAPVDNTNGFATASHAIATP